MQGLQGKESKGPSRDDAVLVNMRKKCIDLHARLEELRDLVAQLRDGVGPERNEAWYTFLKKFDTIGKTTATLTEELDRSMTIGHDNFVAVPVALTTDPAELPDFLRTKLDPEVEREFDALSNMFTSQRAPSSADATTSGGLSVSVTGSGGRTSSAVSNPGVPPSTSAAPTSTGVTSAATSNAPSTTRAVPSSAIEPRIQQFNDLVEAALEHFDEKRMKLATPRPIDPPPSIPSSAAESLIAALTTGQGLGHYNVRM